MQSIYSFGLRGLVDADRREPSRAELLALEMVRAGHRARVVDASTSVQDLGPAVERADVPTLRAGRRRRAAERADMTTMVARRRRRGGDEYPVVRDYAEADARGPGSYRIARTNIVYSNSERHCKREYAKRRLAAADAEMRLP